MSYFKRVVKRRPASVTDEEWVQMVERGRLVGPYFQPRDGRPSSAVVFSNILCWWCRRYHSPTEVETCMAMERPTAVEGNGSTSCSTARMPPWLSQYVELWEFLSKPFYKDGTPRQTGKVSFGLNSGGIQMTLTDPSSSTYCSRNHQTIEDALLAFEVGLSDGSLSWRASGPLKGRKRP